MLESRSPRWRRLINSLAYGALVATVVGLGYLTFRSVSERRHATADGAAQTENVPLIDLSNFATRREKTSDAERLTVSLRLRLTTPGTLDCYAYILARNTRETPKLWAVWPTQGPGGAVTAGGHFNSSNPSTGEPLQLTPSWTRIGATLPHPPGQPPFDTVTIYLVSPKGEVLLARPFAL